MKSLLTRIINRVVNLFKKDSIIYVSDIFEGAASILDYAYNYNNGIKCTTFMCVAITRYYTKSSSNYVGIYAFDKYGFNRANYRNFIEKEYPNLKNCLTDSDMSIWIDTIVKDVLKSKREFLLKLAEQNKGIKFKITNNERN